MCVSVLVLLDTNNVHTHTHTHTYIGVHMLTSVLRGRGTVEFKICILNYLN